MNIYLVSAVIGAFLIYMLGTMIYVNSSVMGKTSAQIEREQMAKKCKMLKDSDCDSAHILRYDKPASK
jgi:hypothetical protein